MNRRDFLKGGLAGLFTAVLGWLGAVKAEKPIEEKWSPMAELPNCSFGLYVGPAHCQDAGWEEFSVDSKVEDPEDEDWHHFPIYWGEPEAHEIRLHIDEDDFSDVRPVPWHVSWLDNYIHGWRLDILTDEEKREAFIERMRQLPRSWYEKDDA